MCAARRHSSTCPTDVESAGMYIIEKQILVWLYFQPGNCAYPKVLVRWHYQPCIHVYISLFLPCMTSAARSIPMSSTATVLVHSLASDYGCNVYHHPHSTNFVYKEDSEFVERITCVLYLVEE